jgi:hypothetical protein
VAVTDYPEFDLLLPVVAFDFDGTIVTDTWPSQDIGTPDEAAFDAIEHYFHLGCEVVIFTARPSAHFPRIWKWLEENNMDHAIYDVTNRKPRACLYFDDRAIRWPLS